jgi:uncharacterized SAM-binding protein YcdF (DUF218 family)
MNKKTFLWGLVTRRERLGLSLRGWAVLLLLLAGFAWLVIHHLQPFLAENNRVNSRILVMEGWVQDSGADAAVHEFQHSNYTKIYTTGGPVNGIASFIPGATTFAAFGALALQRAGLPASDIQVVPTAAVDRDRTYSSALALRRWFQDHGLNIASFNIITEDCHARRTRLLFQKAFGPSVAVGVISLPNPDYDPARWWHYSEGVRVVLGETIAYAYAEFLFHPSPLPASPIKKS